MSISAAYNGVIRPVSNMYAAHNGVLKPVTQGLAAHEGVLKPFYSGEIRWGEPITTPNYFASFEGAVYGDGVWLFEFRSGASRYGYYAPDPEMPLANGYGHSAAKTIYADGRFMQATGSSVLDASATDVFNRYPGQEGSYAWVEGYSLSGLPGFPNAHAIATNGTDIVIAGQSIGVYPEVGFAIGPNEPRERPWESFGMAQYSDYYPAAIPQSIAFGNGVWMAATYGLKSDGTGNVEGDIYRRNPATGVWEEVGAWPSTKIAYGNGVWVATQRRSNGVYYPPIRSDDDGDTWWDFGYQTPDLSHIAYSSGKWVGIAYGDLYLYNPDWDEWVIAVVQPPEGPFTGLSHGGGKWVAGGLGFIIVGK